MKKIKKLEKDLFEGNHSFLELSGSDISDILEITKQTKLKKRRKYGSK